MLKVGLIAPCIGIGGADAAMLNLVRHMQNVEISGVAVQDTATSAQMRWAEQMCGKYVDIGFNNYDEVVAYSDVVVATCVKEVKELDKPFVWWIQNTDDWSKAIAATTKADKYVSCCNEGLAQVPQNKLQDAVIIHNGIDAARCTPKYGRNYVRKRWGLDDRKVLLFCGRFVEEKYPQSIIMSLQELPEEWIGVFVGRGEMEQDLVDEAQRYVPDRVRFMEPMFHIGDVLCASDAFMLVSDFEGHSLSVSEAWLAGLPTVVSDLNVYRDLEATFGELTTIVPKRAPAETLAGAVLEATTAVEQTARARSVAWHNFTGATIAAQWEELLYNTFDDYHRLRRQPPQFMTPKVIPMTSSFVPKEKYA